MRPIVSLIILCALELLMYMDRLSVASVLKDIQDYYGKDDGDGGLVQTVFFGFFVFFSPMFGFLGDRFSRKWILVFSTSGWICMVIVSSLIPKHLWAAFLIARGLSGVGQSSVSVLGPTIIADLYTGTKRSFALMAFFFMIPVGSGLGFLCGSRIGSAFDHWQWGVRFTALIGTLALAAAVLLLREPKRGEAEVGSIQAQTDFFKDLRAIFKVPTYLLSTLGLTCVMFLTGSLEWWAPTVIEHAKAGKLNLTDAKDLTDDQKNNITLVTGGITLFSGLLGVVLGSMIAHWLKTGKICRIKLESADAIVCTVGAAVCVPTMIIGFQLIQNHIVVTYVLFFIGITAACCNLAVVVDLLLSVIVPHRRNTANSLQTMFSSLLGDATGPYIVGLISDSVRHGSTPDDHYKSLVKAFFLPGAVLVLATVLFFISIFTTSRDLRNFEAELESSEPRKESL